MNKIETVFALVFTGLISVLIFTGGWFVGHAMMIETAIKEGHAEYVLVDSTKDVTKFQWKEH